MQFVRSDGYFSSPPSHLSALSLFFLASTDVEALVDELTAQEPLLTAKRRPQLFGLLDKLISKLNDAEKDQFHLLKVMKSHILPLTNIDFDKSGSKFVTGSYDRSCKIWDTEGGKEIHILEG